MKQGILCILGCLIPIALIFILPALGVSLGITFTLAIVLMFACHLFMMKGDSNEEEQSGSGHGYDAILENADDQKGKKS